ncbi:MAG: hypothetical protein ABIV47_16080 [Roseiflexaceae bacterium]
MRIQADGVPLAHGTPVTSRRELLSAESRSIAPYGLPGIIRASHADRGQHRRASHELQR